MNHNVKHMRIFIITLDEYYYIPKFLEGIVDNKDLKILGIGAMSPTLSNESIHKFMLKLFKVFGLKVFVQHCSFYGKYFLLDLRNRILRNKKIRKNLHIDAFRLIVDKCYSVKSIAIKNRINFFNITDVNSPEFISKLQKMNIDLIVSVAATQIFKEELLNLPNICCINVHSSLLPQYRGVSPSFWTLLNSEDKTGVTVHYMDEKIDTGDLIFQKEIKIENNDTLNSLNEKVAEVGAQALNKALEQIENGTVVPIPLDINAGTYYSLPNRNDVKKFMDYNKNFY